MTSFRSRSLAAGALLALLAFAVLAFGAVEAWALTLFELGVFVLAAVWAFRLAWGAARPVWNPFCLPLGLLAAWSGLQYLLGLSVYPYRTALEALKWLALWLLFCLAAQVFIDASIRRWFGRALLFFVFGLCVFGLVQNFTSGGQLYWSIPMTTARIFGPFVNANHFAALLELAAPTAVLLVLRGGEQRLLYVAVLVILLAATVACGSRMGIVLVALEILVVWGVKAVRPSSPEGAPRLRYGLVVAALTCLAGLGWMTWQTPKMAERFRVEQPYAVRWSVVRATWNLFLSRPWTGYGAGTFEQVYPSAALLDLDLLWTHAHNDPLQLAMEFGLAGPAALGWILWLLWRGRWTQDQRLRSILPVVTVLIHSWVDFPLQIPAVAAAWLLTLALLPASGPQPPGGTVASSAENPA